MDHSQYISPLSGRYASSEMQHIFSSQYKHRTWRGLWIALAESEKELGLDITDSQIEELKSWQEEIDFVSAALYEKEFQHDVMAHIHAYGDQCPSAKPIIHLGATSCFVTDNTEVIQLQEGLKLILHRLKRVISQLSKFAREHRKTACLGFTHYQPAQLTTVGKRACMWIQELLMDYDDLEYRLNHLKFRGIKGTTGTQASFLSLFHGDHEKVKELDRKVSKKMGFDKVFSITGQTYTRKQDAQVLTALTGLATSAHKLATDIRLLSNLKEVEEPFGKNQIGSSAMPYKRNPMLSERICALSRFLISLTENAHYTAATQWLERSLDDSANRRLSLSEAFLTADAIILLLERVTEGLVVNKAMIDKRLREELPFMATENILMACVKKGGDRQELHERIRQHSMVAGSLIKQEGRENDLLERIAKDPAFDITLSEIKQLLDVDQFIGRSPEQVDEFLENKGALLC